MSPGAAPHKPTVESGERIWTFEYHWSFCCSRRTAQEGEDKGPAHEEAATCSVWPRAICPSSLCRKSDMTTQILVIPIIDSFALCIVREWSSRPGRKHYLSVGKTLPKKWRPVRTPCKTEIVARPGIKRGFVECIFRLPSSAADQDIWFLAGLPQIWRWGQQVVTRLGFPLLIDPPLVWIQGWLLKYRFEH